LNQQKPPQEEWGLTKTEDEKILSDCLIYNNEKVTAILTFFEKMDNAAVKIGAKFKFTTHS
jgi:hypothetical protein